MDAGIFSLVSQEKISDILKNLQEFTDLRIQLIGPGGETLLEFGPVCGFCRLLHEKVFPPSVCTEVYIKSAKRAQELGEAYIFTCRANLEHIVFPLVHQGELLGSIIVGPFLPDAPDSTVMADLAETCRLPAPLCLDLYDELTHITVCPPRRIGQLKKLIEQLLSPLLPAAHAAMRETRQKMSQQAEINETIQIYKGQKAEPSAHFLYTKECALLETVRTGDVSKAKALLNDIIGYAMFSEGLEIDSLRIHAVELTTLLSRVTISGGAEVETTYRMTADFIPRLLSETGIDALCLLLQEVVESFMETMFSKKDKGNPYIRKALRYMNSHFADHLTLADAAAYVELSPNYFSSLFRETVGMSFSEQLCRIRVEKSRSLLLSDRYTLADIALMVGFPDQSYYSKMFKRIMGITPSRYRG